MAAAELPDKVEGVPLRVGMYTLAFDDGDAAIDATAV
jgi:hypothetical protein